MKRPRIFIGGVRASGEGYPNAENTLRILADFEVAELIEAGAVLPASLRLWQLARNRSASLPGLAARLVGLNLLSWLRVLWLCRKHDWVYVPYPAILFMFFMSLIPERFRPRCIVDAYISVWDSMFSDRGGDSRIGGKVLRWVESRGLKAAAVVLVDTARNCGYFASTFGISQDRVFGFPLAIDERPFREAREVEAEGGALSVVFVGTLIPLHGIQVVLEAALALRDEPAVRFVIVGDGQLGPQVEEFLRRHQLVNVDWRREWATLQTVAATIGKAGVCLGVFGGDAKAARVLPFKLYYALAAGRPVISQAQLSAPAGAPLPPMRGVVIDGKGVAENGRKLADEILRLAGSRMDRESLSHEAGRYFDENLSSERIAECWRQLLSES